ncbi:translocation protein TolB [Oleiphilus sp. HI0071]|jgi:TolB protein|uniref:Tol-Pal system beta propeller repeat protein TolB n=2 Tax=unclassified Oleiphilus TaxID=2631174 RepID=UPI0007C3DF24|nr:Tol-Pal system beta propeller repeat protein TolB [Oleiphilus sp. HI0079]KZY74834.1 translocation protein TolB [Oleiphilus sp. HI0065]KZY80859.1 translocation protein TolB [Oleiphilus sp. HI0071]KZY91214.1 translocation protein TolB [Oleiphilus sp. HI0073]KZZ42237.1 translocation protein TolB [Oleiphilus sp. HI0118]KZZ60316.1 translocation protein TolB [Oleiphilus sp. HI0122]KZZ73312.1 translocation protein TolB [Oleiphilus sp. HI0130]KZZ82041.1 translocation protein TolB [Oleiphilus sp. 
MYLVKFLVFVALTLSASVRAELLIEITKGSDDAVPISVVPFTNRTNQPLSADVARIIDANLLRSGDFVTLPTNKMLSLPDQSTDVHFRDWKMLGQSFVLVGQISSDAAGRRFHVQYELMDVYNQKRIVGELISASATGLRSLAHRISDKVYEAITGVKGAFSTKIAYVTLDIKKGGVSEYRLQLADADGQRSKTLYKGSEPILSPSWSNDAKQLSYVSFETGRPAIYIQNIKTGKRRQVTAFRGLNSSPMWSPDDKKLLMTLSKDGNAELYSFDIATSSLDRLTNHYGIDTEGSWSRDGRKIVFTSDRSGTPQIYEMDLIDRRPKRLTFTGRYNSRPRFSQDGDKVYFVHQSSSNYHIASMNEDGSDQYILTDTPLDESPSVSPNGRMIIYATKRNGQGVLGVVSVDGDSKYFLPSSFGQVREPAWSPFLN